jgi:hypothetical protein
LEILMANRTTRTFSSTVVLLLAAALLCQSPIFASGKWTFYGSDKEGKHLYQKVDQGQQSPGIVRVWDELMYSPEGRAAYMDKRKRHKHPVSGFESVAYRMVLYELNCFSERKEYVMLEVLEMDPAGKTLDYAKAGSYKDWHDIPDGSIVDLLHKSVCPTKRTTE